MLIGLTIQVTIQAVNITKKENAALKIKAINQPELQTKE